MKPRKPTEAETVVVQLKTAIESAIACEVAVFSATRARALANQRVQELLDDVARLTAKVDNEEHE